MIEPYALTLLVRFSIICQDVRAPYRYSILSWQFDTIGTREWCSWKRSHIALPLLMFTIVDTVSDIDNYYGIECHIIKLP